MRSTLSVDERALALVLASRADADDVSSPRGYLPAGIDTNVAREHVLKWGNRHCGEDKCRVVGAVHAESDAILEPFGSTRIRASTTCRKPQWPLSTLSLLGGGA